MLDDSIFREFQSMPYEEQLQWSQRSMELRETLLMGEIFKCGREIFDGEEDLQQISSQRRYIYDYDYKLPSVSGNSKHLQSVARSVIAPTSLLNNNNTSFLQYQADEISFTLSSEDNPTRHSQKDTIIINSKNQSNPSHVSWKNHLVETPYQKINQDEISKKNISSETLSGKYQPLSRQKVGKWKKPLHSRQGGMYGSRESKSKESELQQIEAESPIKIKDNWYQKTFDLSNHKISYFPDSTVKKRKAIFQQRPPQRVTANNIHQNYSSSHYPQQKPATYLTPQKTSSTRLQIPLSEQITKNVYSRLKQQVRGNSFIKEFQMQEKRTQQRSEQIWKNFIGRSDNWMQKKKINLIERQVRERYQMDNFAQTKRRDQQSPTKQQQYYSYVGMRHQQKQVSQMMRFQDRKFQPEYTFRLKNNRRSPQKSLQKKKQSSVQNCINKLKTQTQLLKVKLLSPLKSKIEDDDILNHYKQLNESESKRLVRKFTGSSQG